MNNSESNDEAIHFVRWELEMYGYRHGARGRHHRDLFDPGAHKREPTAED